MRAFAVAGGTASRRCIAHGVARYVRPQQRSGVTVPPPPPPAAAASGGLSLQRAPQVLPSLQAMTTLFLPSLA